MGQTRIRPESDPRHAGRARLRRIGLIGAGVFVADPELGFPPGSPESAGALSRSGFLHFVAGAIGFYALIGACFVFARHFTTGRHRGWAAYSFITGLAFFASFAALASGSTSPATILTFYAAVAWIWIWHAMLHLKFLREERAFLAASRVLRTGS